MKAQWYEVRTDFVHSTGEKGYYHYKRYGMKAAKEALEYNREWTKRRNQTITAESITPCETK